MNQSASQSIKEIALQLGFDLVGISKPIVPNNHKERYLNWLDKSYQADMSYLDNNIDLRFDPSVLFPNLKSILVLGQSYYNKEWLDNKYGVSIYSLGRDYHKEMKSRMKRLILEIKKIYPDCNARPFVDSAPVLERYFAKNAGLGWIGKNTCLINKSKGSFMFLAEVFLDVELDFDSPFTKNHCGNCTRCIDACPTQAITPDGIDSNRCLSYHTIESSELIPDNIVAQMGNQVFGCDVCQSVCPWNSKLTDHCVKDFEPREKSLEKLNITALSVMSDEDFKKVFAGSPFMRAGKKKLLQTLQQLS